MQSVKCEVYSVEWWFGSVKGEAWSVTCSV